MKRVLIVWQAAYPWEVRIEKMARSFMAEGCEVALVCRRTKHSEKDHEVINGIQIHRIGSLSRIGRILSVPLPFNFFWISKIFKRIQSFKPDMVVARDIPVTEITLGAFGKIGRGFKKPLLLLDMAEHYPAAMRGWKKYERGFGRFFVHFLRLPDLIERRAVKRFNLISVVCDEQKDRLIRDYQVPQSKIVVLNNSPTAGSFKNARTGSSFPIRTIAHHGHMTPERGLILLIEAFSRVAIKYPDVNLVFAGSGEVAEDVKQLIETYGLQSRVQMTGRFQFSDLDRLYGECDAAVLPYPPNEFINHTLSNKIFDYMLCGKPLLISGVIPMKRLIQETGGGIVFEPYDVNALEKGLNQLLSLTSDQLASMGKNAEKVVTEKYTWDVEFSNFANRCQLEVSRLAT